MRDDPTWAVAQAALLAALCDDFGEAQAVRARMGSLAIPFSWEEAWGQVAIVRDELRRERALSMFEAIDGAEKRSE